MATKFFSNKDRINIRWFWIGYMKDKLPWLIFILLLVILQGFVYQQFLSFTEKGLRVIFEDGQFSDLVRICGDRVGFGGVVGFFGLMCERLYLLLRRRP